MEKKTAIGTPVRVEKCMGIYHFEITAYELDGKMHPGFCGQGRTYNDAKNDFWEQWRDAYPNVYLSCKLSSRG